MEERLNLQMEKATLTSGRIEVHLLSIAFVGFFTGGYVLYTFISWTLVQEAPAA